MVNATDVLKYTSESIVANKSNQICLVQQRFYFKSHMIFFNDIDDANMINPSNIRDHIAISVKYINIVVIGLLMIIPFIWINRTVVIDWPLASLHMYT